MSEEPATDDSEVETDDSSTELSSDIGTFIREQRTLAELSLRRLADLAGVSNPYLSQIERGLRKPSAEILQQLGKALQVSAETMYVQAGMLDSGHGQDQSGLESAIRRSRELTSEQRKALLGVYRSFVAANGATPDQENPVDGAGDESADESDLASEVVGSNKDQNTE